MLGAGNFVRAGLLLQAMLFILWVKACIRGEEPHWLLDGGKGMHFMALLLFVDMDAWTCLSVKCNDCEIDFDRRQK